jgi:hypothetical protein
MEGVGWLGAIIIGGIAGWIAEKVTESRMGSSPTSSSASSGPSS